MAKSQINFGELGGGSGNISGDYGTVQWNRTNAGGLVIPTTKKALGVSMTNSYSQFLFASAKDGKLYTDGVYDTYRPFVFTDNSISCSEEWGSSTYTFEYYIIYED